MAEELLEPEITADSAEEGEIDDIPEKGIEIPIEELKNNLRVDKEVCYVGFVSCSDADIHLRGSRGISLMRRSGTTVFSLMRGIQQLSNIGYMKLLLQWNGSFTNPILSTSLDVPQP